MSHESGDRNLLFATLALQMDFISREVARRGNERLDVEKAQAIGRHLGFDGSD